jgi:hypothetical protein
MIWSYLRNKSLNMQTLKDEMMKEVIWSSLPMTIANDLVCIGVGPIPKVMAIFVIYTRKVMAAYFFLQIFVTVVVKYGIIFYGSYIALIDDRAIVKFSRISCSVGAILFNVGLLVEADVTKNPNFLALTTGMHQKGPDFVLNENKIVYVLVIIDLIAVILVHIKIEIYKREEILAGLHWSEYTIDARRKVVGVIFISALLVLSRYVSPFDNHIERLMQYTITQFMVVVIIPFFMIVKNENLFHYVSVKFKCYNNNIHSLNV